ncbi:MAG: alanine--glyoxylate aminotransferase family protein [Chloroflexi bacterium]|nr:alanine--glyoxylate aminotransferase family protein [Chloroflexota bacterium]
MKQRNKLMIPGPVPVWDETLDALSEQVMSNYTDDFVPMYQATMKFLHQVFQTENDIFVLTAPGSGAVEIGVASLFNRGEKVAVVTNGPFAGRLIEVMRAYALDVIEIENEWGKAADLDQVRQALKKERKLAGVAVVANETGTGVRNPVKELAALAHERDLPILVDAVSGMGGYDLPVDKWALDIVCTSSNKALEIPPGLGIVSVSPRAWQVIDAKQATATRGWYYNLSTWKAYQAQRPDNPSPTTMATGLIAGLHASLQRIIEGETLPGHWARYAWAQKVVRAGLRNIGFEMLVRDEDASFTVTAVCKRADMDHEQEVRDFLDAKHGYTVSGTWGKLTGEAFRISHMGQSSSPEYLYPFLLGIEDFVRSVKEVDIPVGSSLVGLTGKFQA